RLTILMTPNIKDRPLASRKRSAPYEMPLKDCAIQNSGLTRRAGGSAEAQQPGGVLAHDLGLVGPRELDRVVADDVDRLVVAHVEAEIGAEHHPVRAHGGDQVAQRP